MGNGWVTLVQLKINGWVRSRDPEKNHPWDCGPEATPPPDLQELVISVCHATVDGSEIRRENHLGCIKPCK